MRIPILFVVATVCFSSVSAQQTKQAAKQWSAKEETLYMPEKKDSATQQMPGPSFDVQQYLKANLVYPAAAREAGIEGRVIVRFTLDAKGKVMDPRVMRGVSPELDAEALRVVAAMPKWKPAKQNGKAVKVLYSLSVEFKP